MDNKWEFQSIEKALRGFRKVLPEIKLGILRGGEFDGEVIDGHDLEYTIKAVTDVKPNTNSMVTTIHLYWRVWNYPHAIYEYVWQMTFEYDRRLRKNNSYFNAMVHKCIRQYMKWKSDDRELVTE